MVVKQNLSRIEHNEDRFENKRQNLERRQRVLSMYKEHLIQDLKQKLNRCESMEKQKGDIRNHSMTNHKQV